VGWSLLVGFVGDVGGGLGATSNDLKPVTVAAQQAVGADPAALLSGRRADVRAEDGMGGELRVDVGGRRERTLNASDRAPDADAAGADILQEALMQVIVGGRTQLGDGVQSKHGPLYLAC